MAQKKLQVSRVYILINEMMLLTGRENPPVVGWRTKENWKQTHTLFAYLIKVLTIRNTKAWRFVFLWKCPILGTNFTLRLKQISLISVFRACMIYIFFFFFKLTCKQSRRQFISVAKNCINYNILILLDILNARMPCNFHYHLWILNCPCNYRLQFYYSNF